MLQSELRFGGGSGNDRAGRAGLMKNASELSSLFNESGLRVLQENNDAKAFRDDEGQVVCP